MGFGFIVFVRFFFVGSKGNEITCGHQMEVFFTKLHWHLFKVQLSFRLVWQMICCNHLHHDHRSRRRRRETELCCLVNNRECFNALLKYITFAKIFVCDRLRTSSVSFWCERTFACFTIQRKLVSSIKLCVVQLKPTRKSESTFQAIN